MENVRSMVVCDLNAIALVLISVFLLASSILCLLTGRKPTLVLFIQAYQRWSNMINGTATVPKSYGNIIDAEVK